MLGLLAVALPAQGDPFEQLELRVASLRPAGQCVIDRGARDLVEVDDRVVLAPRNAPPVNGRVVQVDERTSLVQLLDPTASVPPGTRGHVLLPRARVQAAAPPPPVEPDQPVAGEDPAAEEEWVPGMPLLGRRRPPRPEERLSRMRGRVYGAANLVRTIDSFSEHSYLDAGAQVDINNVGGTGGVVRFHGEYNYSTEFSGNQGDDLRLYELSYENGGTRWSPFRWQVGRFLPRDMPEFGLLDGIEVGYRTEGGDRYGASLGYLPELDDDLESAADLQIAAWYVWSQDIGERVTFGIGYQKTWHRFDEDRDLVVLKGRYLPNSGWDVSSAVWIDFYNGDDNLKDESVEVTRANLFASRRWVGEGGIEFFYDHEEYPELLRNDNPQTILPLTLIEAHVDRVSVRAWLHSSERTQWFTRVTGWIDEEDEGGAAEVGVELSDLFGERTQTSFALFDVIAAASSVRGFRVQHGGPYASGRLDVLYELGFVTYDDFPNDIDDLVQHRLGGMLSTTLGGNWDATFFADVTLYDDEASYGVGVYLQRLF